MKILWIKANKLLPLHSGGDIRSFHILKHLSASHPVTFLSYYDGIADNTYDAKLKEFFPSAVTVCTGKKSDGLVSRSMDYLRRLSESAPYAISRFESPLVREKINSLIRTGGFDVVVADFLDAAVNLPEQLSIPAVLFPHNVESEIWRRHANTESNLLKRLLYKFEFKKMLRYEKDTLRRFRNVIAVSQHDREVMLELGSGAEITVVPTGVDVNQYRSDGGQESRSSVVMFVGAMDWEPNIDGAEFFLAEIWKPVLAEVPDAKFSIVGRNPDRRVQKFASSSVQITGRVESVADYLKQAAVVVVPLRIGGGTRLKIYEAMAAGRAVVSTSIGAEGLDVTPGVDILIADDPKDFSAAIISLLKDSELRRRCERAAQKTAGEYDWSVIAMKFDEALGKAVPLPASFNG